MVGDDVAYCHIKAGERTPRNKLRHTLGSPCGIETAYSVASLSITYTDCWFGLQWLVVV